MSSQRYPFPFRTQPFLSPLAGHKTTIAFSPKQLISAELFEVHNPVFLNTTFQHKETIFDPL